MTRTIKDKTPRHQTWLNTPDIQLVRKSKLISQEMWCNTQTRGRWSDFFVTNYFFSYYLTENVHPFHMQDQRWNVTEEEYEGQWWQWWDMTSFSNPLWQSVRDKGEVRRLRRSKSQRISLLSGLQGFYDLHSGLFGVTLPPFGSQGCEGFNSIEHKGTSTQAYFLFPLEHLHSTISTISLLSGMLNPKPHDKVIWTMSGCVKKMYNTWKAESSGDRRIVLALASFSSGDETWGNSPSTTDNDETEPFMKESIDPRAPHWCCKPHATQRGAGVYFHSFVFHRLFLVPEWKQYLKSYSPWKAFTSLSCCKSVSEVKIDLVKSKYGGMV